MVFASARIQRYIQFHPWVESAKAFALGPLYFVWLGLVEAILLYAVFGFLWGLAGFIFIHALLAGLFPLWVNWLLSLRGYERTTRGEVAGRYRRSRTLWRP
jgi:hypothetical protein